MMELSIEEKAKRYDEAKLRMSAAYNSNRCTIGFMNEIFPELKESEDKKPNGAIVMEDFNDGDGFYKVNLAYLSKSQVELIENLVASWQWFESDKNKAQY